VSFRLNEQEQEQLKKRIDESGLNQQEYIVQAVLKGKITIKKDEKGQALKNILPELKRIGNNINQIAKRCNEGGQLATSMEVKRMSEELNEIWRLLKQ
jgi:Ni,Fe-hydrogenase III large subunit